MIVILDTNVLISALLNANSIPGRLIDLAADGRFQVAMSSTLISEWERVLTYPRIRKALAKIPPARFEQFRRDYFGMILLVPSELPVKAWVAADPDDDHVVQWDQA